MLGRDEAIVIRNLNRNFLRKVDVADIFKKSDFTLFWLTDG